MSDFVTLGELLIDFTPYGKQDGRNLFMQNAGGSVANAAAALVTQGLTASYLGMVGDDQFGHFLKNTLIDIGIETSGLILSKQYNTTLAFVHLFENAERDFSFYRKHGADIMFSKDDIDEEIIRDAKVFHFSCVSMTDEPSRSATYEGAKIASDNGVVISFDPNYRAPIWNSEQEAKIHMQKGIEIADIVKISDNEVELLFPGLSFEQAAREILSLGVTLVYITLGSKGAMYASRQGIGMQTGFKAKAVDSTGAGDCFTGSVIAQFIKSGKILSEYTLQDLDSSTVFANAAASICVEKRGGIASMPNMNEIEQRINLGQRV